MRLDIPVPLLYDVRMKAKAIYIHVILLILISLAVYANSLNNSFVWDDTSLIVNNAYIKNLIFVPKIFTTDLFHTFHGKAHITFYRPLQSLSFMLDYFSWHLNPFGYHLTNVILHILVALAVISLYGGSLKIIIIVLGLLVWDRYAVVMRSVTMQARDHELSGTAVCTVDESCEPGRNKVVENMSECEAGFRDADRSVGTCGRAVASKGREKEDEAGQT